MGGLKAKDNFIGIKELKRLENSHLVQGPYLEMFGTHRSLLLLLFIISGWKIQKLIKLFVFRNVLTSAPVDLLESYLGDNTFNICSWKG